MSITNVPSIEQMATELLQRKPSSAELAYFSIGYAVAMNVASQIMPQCGQFPLCCMHKLRTIDEYYRREALRYIDLAKGGNEGGLTSLSVVRIPGSPSLN